MLTLAMFVVCTHALYLHKIGTNMSRKVSRKPLYSHPQTHLLKVFFASKFNWMWKETTVFTHFIYFLGGVRIQNNRNISDKTGEDGISNSDVAAADRAVSTISFQFKMIFRFETLRLGKPEEDNSRQRHYSSILLGLFGGKFSVFKFLKFNFPLGRRMDRTG